MVDYVILVDEGDADVGVAEKMAAHESPGMLHRAISVFLFDRSGRLLLQQRAVSKHHFRGLWANTCCSHPRPGEAVIAAGRRRLGEEMGCDTELEPVGTFTYRAEDAESGLVEHELDHVLVGSFDDDPKPNPAEVQAYRWVDVDGLDRDLRENPDRYAPWFAQALDVALRRA